MHALPPPDLSESCLYNENAEYLHDSVHLLCCDAPEWHALDIAEILHECSVSGLDVRSKILQVPCKPEFAHMSTAE